MDCSAAIGPARDAAEAALAQVSQRVGQEAGPPVAAEELARQCREQTAR